MIARLLRRRQPDPPTMPRVEQIMAQAERDLADLIDTYEAAIRARVFDRAAELFDREAMQATGDACLDFELAAKTMRADAEALRKKVKDATDGC